jgi:hypothetical protein
MGKTQVVRALSLPAAAKTIQATRLSRAADLTFHFSKSVRRTVISADCEYSVPIFLAAFSWNCDQS